MADEVLDPVYRESYVTRLADLIRRTDNPEFTAPVLPAATDVQSEVNNVSTEFRHKMRHVYEAMSTVELMAEVQIQFGLRYGEEEQEAAYEEALNRVYGKDGEGN